MNGNPATTGNSWSVDSHRPSNHLCRVMPAQLAMLMATPTVHCSSLCDCQETRRTDTNVNDVLSVQPFNWLRQQIIIGELLT